MAGIVGAARAGISLGSALLEEFCVRVPCTIANVITSRLFPDLSETATYMARFPRDALYRQPSKALLALEAALLRPHYLSAGRLTELVRELDKRERSCLVDILESDHVFQRPPDWVHLAGWDFVWEWEDIAGKTLPASALLTKELRNRILTAVKQLISNSWGVLQQKNRTFVLQSRESLVVPVKKTGSAEGANINDRLPTEMLRLIFSLLPARDLVSAALVCRSWENVVDSLPVTESSFEGEFPHLTVLDRRKLERDFPSLFSFSFQFESAGLFRTGLIERIEQVYCLKTQSGLDRVLVEMPGNLTIRQLTQFLTNHLGVNTASISRDVLHQIGDNVIPPGWYVLSIDPWGESIGQPAEDVRARLEELGLQTPSMGVLLATLIFMRLIHPERFSHVFSSMMRCPEQVRSLHNGWVGEPMIFLDLELGRMIRVFGSNVGDFGVRPGFIFQDEGVALGMRLM